jgi:hypothetical protein
MSSQAVFNVISPMPVIVMHEAARGGTTSVRGRKVIKTNGIGCHFQSRNIYQNSHKSSLPSGGLRSGSRLKNEQVCLNRLAGHHEA